MSKSTVRLIHWNDDEAAARVKQLRAAGFAAQYEKLVGQTKQMRIIVTDPPDAYVVDLSRMFSHGREIGLALRQRASTRQIPLVFVDGDPEKLARLKSILPDATYTTWPTIKSAINRTLKAPKANPIVPRSIMAGYSGTPLPKKLGIKANFTVALHGAPEGFAKTIGELPEGVKLSDGANGAVRNLTIYFVRSNRDLQTAMPKIVRFAHHGPVWIASPKKASGMQTDVNQNAIRDLGLSSGLVDYKVCAIDATWSGLLFCLRKQEK
jgi:hypothetical protein